MFRKNKTSKKKRTNYIYYGEDNSKTILMPGKKGVTEVIIETLHNFDDLEFDNDRRERRRHESINEVNDKAKMVKDYDADVEDIVFSNFEREAVKEIVHKALSKLKPDQQDLINNLYLSDNPMSQKEYAYKLGIEEDSVKKKAYRTRKKLKEIILNKF